ncbi:MAG: hypothetical protein WAM71_20185 [Candidatus Korobacteraceae bacterium]
MRGLVLRVLDRLAELRNLGHSVATDSLNRLVAGYIRRAVLQRTEKKLVFVRIVALGK